MKKILSIIGLAIILLAILQLIGVMPKASNITILLLGILLIIEAIQSFKTRKIESILLLLASTYIFIVIILNFIRYGIF